MNFFHRVGRRPVQALLLAVVMIAGIASAQDFGSIGISDVVAMADRRLQRGDYSGAIPALREVIRRTQSLKDPEGRKTCQTCRFHLARAMFQTGDIPGGMKVLQDYLDNKPITNEKMALRMVAQGHFESKEWAKVEKVVSRLLAMSGLDRDDLYNGNLLLGQALFRQKKWAESVKPLTYAAYHAEEERVQLICEIMAVRALVESKDWRTLFGRLPGVYRTDAKYDISLNLTLMKAAKDLYDEEEYLNSLLLYRWVLPREKLAKFSEDKIGRLRRNMQDKKEDLKKSELESLRTDIKDIEASLKTLNGLPPYEDEVTFRIGEIYAEVLRYWEGYVLFDKLYRQDRTSDIGEASLMKSVLILYEVEQIERAEERIILYLNERPDGVYARTLLSMMLRDNLVRGNIDRVIELRQYVEGLPPTTDPDELSLQADLHYMLAFAYFQKRDYQSAGSQFSVIIKNIPDSSHYADSLYYRGMTYMLQAQYAEALADFNTYQAKSEHGEHYPASLFREGVCLFGLERVEEAEAAFTFFIDEFPDNQYISEAYSMRGDIEASKTATQEDPHTLDRALADYRKAIDKATTSLQSSYAAFQAAKVYKLEYKWQEIIDLMNYYMDRWEEEADVSEATFWIGQAQIELGQVQEAVKAYLETIERFGNDPQLPGVDKIIYELVKVANHHLSEGDREGLAIKVKLELTNVDPRENVLELRLRITQALLQGEDVAAALGQELLQSNLDLSISTPASLGLMCDAAVETGNVEQMGRLSDYFIQSYEESELLWKGYRARTFKHLAEKNYKDALWAIDEAQGMFGAEPHMGWAQLTKADTELKMGKIAEAFESYNMCMGVPEWRGPIQAEAVYGMGTCRAEEGKYEEAHNLYQRTYMLFKAYDDGKWAAKGYIAAADMLRKLGRDADAVNTLKEMLQDEYVNTLPVADQVREQLKKLGVQVEVEDVEEVETNE